MPRVAAFLFCLMPVTLLPQPMAAQTGLGHPCEFIRVCDPYQGCHALAKPQRHTLDIVPDTGGRDWLWITKGAPRRDGQRITPLEGESATYLFGPTTSDDETILVTLSLNGSAVMTRQGHEPDTGEAVASVYFGTCGAAG